MRFLRFSVTLFAALAVLPTASAQPVPQPKDGKLVITAAVSPASVPVPALKYLLLPELRDQQPGNQVQAFYKCSMEQHNFYHDKGEIEKREKWSTAPLLELAGDKAWLTKATNALYQHRFKKNSHQKSRPTGLIVALNAAANR